MPTKKRYRSRSRRHKDLTNIRLILAIAIIVLLVSTIAYSTCTKQAENERLSALAGGLSDQELAIVVTDTLEDGRMIHYPGFDVMFSYAHHQPYYVSWVLTPEHVRNVKVKRTDKFRPDPEVEGSAQLSDYKNSGYDRGHMAPSADFRYDYDAQEATFFLTNMSPQHKSLNEGAWKNLEEQCRNWALRDSTLIIVTGPILTDYLTETIGSTPVTVPDRYFKVVLAPYANPPRAIGFIMPNSKVAGGVQSSVVTVDQVEEITGFDFFSSLPDELENEIEAQAKYSDWQYSKSKKNK